MDRNTFFGQRPQDRVEALIGLNAKPVSRAHIHEILASDLGRETLSSVLDDLTEQGRIVEGKKGFTSKAPLPSLAVVHVSNVGQNHARKYDHVVLSPANDPGFDIPITISRANARKSELSNGDMLLVSLGRKGGNSLEAKVIDRYGPAKSPHISVKFTKDALKEGDFAKIYDRRARGSYVSVDNIPEDTKKHSIWNVEVPRHFSFFQPQTKVLDELRHDLTGKKIVDVLARKYALSPKVSKHTAKKTRDILEKTPDIEGYRELREPVRVIDPKGAFDHDDGVYVEELPGGGFRTLCVTADVPAYAPPLSTIFSSAMRRGPTHFFAGDGVAFHMLHPQLVETCSLYAGGSKPVDFVETFWSDDLDIIEERHGLGVISEQVDMSYTEADRELISGASMTVYREFLDRAIEQSKKDSALELSDTDQPGRLMGASEFLVSYLMTHTNHARSRHAQEHDLPFIYRIHGFCQNEQQYARVYNALEERGYDLPGNFLDIDTVALNDIFWQAEQRRERDVIQKFVMSNLLEQARYSTEPGYHWGLDLDVYAHTTSPVRRPSDLLNAASRHRVLHPMKELSPTALTDQWAVKQNATPQTRKDADVRRMDKMAISDAWEKSLSRIAATCRRHEMTHERVAGDYKHLNAFRDLASMTGHTLKCNIRNRDMDTLEIIHPKMGVRTQVTKDHLPKEFKDPKTGCVREFAEGQKAHVRVDSVSPETLEWNVTVAKLVSRPHPANNMEETLHFPAT